MNTLARRIFVQRISGRVCSFFDSIHRRWTSFWAALMTGLMYVTPTLCATNTTMDAIFDEMVNILFTIARYVGAIIVVLGVFNWIMAQKDENADGQSRAIKFCVVGIALVALKTLVTPILNLL